MRLSYSTNLKRATITVGALAAAGALACSDGLTRPQSRASADDDFATSGVIVSSLMRADAGADAPISSLSVHAEFGGGGRQATLGSPTRVAIDPAQASALRTQALTPVKLALGSVGPTFDRQGGGRKSIVRPHAKGRSLRFRKDGKDIELQFVDDPRGGSRPPAATVTLVNGRAAAVNQYTYSKIGKSWLPTSSRATIYDSTGHATFVVSNTFRTSTVSEASFGHLGADILASGAGKLIAALGALAQPDMLYAATTADEIDAGCGQKATAASIAEFGWLGALAALAVAWGGCVTTIFECPGVLAAQAALAIADNAMGKAEAEYYLCLQQQQQQQQPPASPPTSGGGSPPPTTEPPPSPPVEDQGPACGEITWEISYDDGATWDYLDTTVTC